MKLHAFEVVSNVEVADDIFKLVLRAPELAREMQPGQFMSFKVPNDPTQIVRVPLSYSHSDTVKGTVETYYARVGKGTTQLSALSLGDTGEVLGPLGKGWSVDPEKGRALAVAGGLGITPIIAVTRACVAADVPVDVIVGAQTARKLAGVSELESLGADSVTITTDDGSRGMRGFTTEAAEKLLYRFGFGQVFTCGPAPMMYAVAVLANDNYASCQVSMERMMTCGFGACNTCNVALAKGGYARCCTDGPVFGAEVVAW